MRRTAAKSPRRTKLEREDGGEDEDGERGQAEKDGGAVIGDYFLCFSEFLGLRGALPFRLLRSQLRSRSGSVRC